MAGLPDYLLVHTATPQRFVEEQTATPEWIEGEPGPQTNAATDAGVSFPCILFLPGPGGAQANAYRIRAVEQPTMLFNPYQDDGVTANVLGRDDLVDIYAPELAPWLGGLETVRWLVNGIPQAFGPPGEVVGLQATLERVAD